MKSLYVITGLSLLSLGAHAANPRGSGPDAAREELKSLKVPEGLEITLFASEPMVRNPADMDIDSRGRVWITEGANYRLFQKWGKLRPEGDRIVILEDSNGDGAADKEKTFYQGNDINTALGICVLGNKVIVSCSPNVFVFTDENGDDVADKKEILFTGISGVDHDHGVHAFSFGPDGKLYFNMGNEAKQLKRPDGSPVIDRFGVEVNNKRNPYQEGMVFRCILMAAMSRCSVTIFGTITKSASIPSAPCGSQTTMMTATRVSASITSWIMATTATRMK